MGEQARGCETVRSLGRANIDGLGTRLPEPTDQAQALSDEDKEATDEIEQRRQGHGMSF